MLNRPRLDGTSATVLYWKQQYLDQRICKMSCSTFRIHFKRLCLVSGLEKPPRPYFLRIGAGANLEAFGKLAGDNEQLFKYLDHAWKDFDPDAPVYMTETQRLELESRRDTTAMVQHLSNLREDKADPAEIQQLSQRLNAHRKRLEELAILARRDAYFKDKARTRQMGWQVSQPTAGQKETPDGQEKEHYTGSRSHTDLDIDTLMKAWAPGTVFDTGAESRALSAMTWLVHYLSGSLSAISRPRQDQGQSLEALSPDVDGQSKLQLPGGKQAMCLICGKTFGRRAELTRHATVHIALLAQDFSCPQCGHVTSSPSEFSNHVERRHGKQYAPHFITEASFTDVHTQPEPTPKIPCAVCHLDVSVASVLKHFNSQHTDLPNGLKLTCSACIDQNELDLNTWFAHLANRHRVLSVEQCPFCRHFFYIKAIAQHTRKLHFDCSSGPVTCPICVQHGTIVLLEDHNSWLVHTAIYHTIQTDDGIKRKAFDTGALGQPALPPQVQRQSLQPSYQKNDRLFPPSTLDLSLIDPALLDFSLSDPGLLTDELSTESLLSPWSLDGSTVCTSPISDSGRPDTEPSEADVFVHQPSASPVADSGCPDVEPSEAVASAYQPFCVRTNLVARMHIDCPTTNNNVLVTSSGPSQHSMGITGA
ncbi:hypothetical protein VM1G_10597 [Cytospora mali]|uniref:C2H2-type domain-containing protein n=1 Tax=Cytospora mali TaxID=578113 RepID=A0A194VIV2_CYTMA|nr:hypothetical protein VM1G_10597 [Valsa mali]